jgi:hypothetical protein
MSNQVSLDSGEMVGFLKHIIENNQHIQKQGKKPVATEIIGESGLGKTSVAIQIAEQNGLNFVKLNLAQIEELGDLVGFPLRQFQLAKKQMVKKKFRKQDGTIIEKEVEGDDVDYSWVDENAVEQYTKQGYTFTGKKRMTYCPPEWIADKQGGGILLLDDWNRADIRFIQAVMELVDRQEYISWKLPENWHILLTANPDDGEYLVNSIDVAQRTRFVSVVMKWNHERWAEWAESQGIDGRCINFMLMHPEVVDKRVNPRSITTFFNSISSFDNFNNHLPMIQMIGEGSVGPEVATMFTMFINNRLDKLISPKEMVLDKDEVKVAERLMNAIAENGPESYRADIASLLTTRLVNWTVHYSKDNSITEEILNRIAFLVKHPDIFTDDLKYHIVKKILNGNKQKFQKMLFDSTIQELATK